MRLVDKVTKVGRWDFLRATAGATALAAIAPSVSAEALAEPTKTISQSDLATLTKMARDVYPHDAIPDVFYQNAIASIDKDVEASTNKNLLKTGIADLDAEAMKSKGKKYLDLAEEADRVDVLKAIESSEFFGKVRSSMVTAFYNQPELWPKLGYEGASFDKGGYIERGFNDIDWL